MKCQMEDRSIDSLTYESKDVFISFTTHDARVAHIEPMIRSVLSQWPSDRVLLTVSDGLEVPFAIRQSGIHIVRSEDYGAFKKHSPTFLRLGISRYIVVDDDCIIPQGWFENLVRWSERLPGHVVCGAGRVWPTAGPMSWGSGSRFHGCNVSSPTRTDIYIGSGTALFEPRFFEDSVFPFEDPGFGGPGHSNWNGGDDIWFSAKLKPDIPITVVPYAGQQNEPQHPAELHYASCPDCIWLSEKSRGFAGWNRALGHFEGFLRAKAQAFPGNF